MLPGLVFAVLERLPAPDESGCRVWPGSMNSNGYGKATVRVGPGRYLTVYVHRVAFGWAHGFVPSELDHLCRVRACGESTHLEAVTRRQNLERSPAWSGNLHPETCAAGHRWSEVGWWANGASRKCRACHRATSLAAYYRKQERYGR